MHLAIRCHPRFGCRPAEDAQGPYLETNPEPPVIPELSPDEEYVFGSESSHHYPWIVGIRGCEIIYTDMKDNTASFDPVEWIHANRETENDKEVHLGIRLMAGIADDMQYVQALGLNTLIITVKGYYGMK